MSVAHDKYVARQQQRNAVPLALNPLTSALMIIDMQEYFLNPESPFSRAQAYQMPGICDYMQERARTVSQAGLLVLLFPRHIQ